MTAIIDEPPCARLHYAMIIPALALLLAASVHAAPAAPAVVLSTAAAVAANQRLSARCARNPFGLDEFLANPSARADLATCAVDEERLLLEYSVCRALQGAPGCDVLDGTKVPAQHCRAIAAEAKFAYAALRGEGDAEAACRGALELDGQRGPSAGRACRAFLQAARNGDIAAACPALQKERTIEGAKGCEEIKIYWSGAARDCDGFKDPAARWECSSRAALVAGLREPERCVMSPACQALSKVPNACEGLKAQFTRALCGRAAKDLSAAAALDPRQKPELDRQAQQKGAKATEARVAAAAAAVAAEKAKVEAAAAKARAEAQAERDKVARLAALDAKKKAEALAAVNAKAEAEAKKKEKAAEIEAKNTKEQYKKGQPMEAISKEGAAALKALEEGRPLPKPGVKKPAAQPPSSDGR